MMTYQANRPAENDVGPVRGFRGIKEFVECKKFERCWREVRASPERWDFESRALRFWDEDRCCEEEGVLCGCTAHRLSLFKVGWKHGQSQHDWWSTQDA